MRFRYQKIGSNGRRHRRHGNIINRSASITAKMCMRRCIGVVMRLLVIYGQLLNGTLLNQNLQCIIYRHSRQRGYFLTQLGIYTIGRRMCTVLHQIIHNSNPLYRRLYVMSHQMIVSVVREKISCASMLEVLFDTNI